VTFAAERCYELLDKMAAAFKKAQRRPGPAAIHDVRVSIRRLRQCLNIFEAQFPGQSVEKINNRIHKVLKAAGKLRNFDIAMELLKQSKQTDRILVRALREDRKEGAKAIQDRLAKLSEKNSVEKWRARLLPVGDSEHGGDGEDAAKEAGTLLPRMAREFFEAGDRAVHPDCPPAAMHKFRIRSKKFRYTLELFAPLYGDELDKRMDALRQAQTRLGDINDCVATAELVKDYRRDSDDASDSAIATLEREAAKKTAAFRRWWAKSFNAKQKDNWVRYLAQESLKIK